MDESEIAAELKLTQAALRVARKELAHLKTELATRNAELANATETIVLLQGELRDAGRKLGLAQFKLSLVEGE